MDISLELLIGHYNRHNRYKRFIRQKPRGIALSIRFDGTRLSPGNRKLDSDRQGIWISEKVPVGVENLAGSSGITKISLGKSVECVAVNYFMSPWAERKQFIAPRQQVSNCGFPA